MSNSTMVVVTRWVLIGMLALVLFLAVLQPMAGVIGLVALILGYNLVITLSPRLHEALKENKDQRKRRVKEMLTKRKQTHSNTGPAAFSPTHYLVCSTIDPPIRRLVDKESFVVGRDAGCDLRIPGEGSVSGQHCRITYAAHSREYYVEDLRSSLGTFVGTKRLEANSPEKLFDEAEIFISNLRFTFTRTVGGGPSGGAGRYGGPIKEGETQGEDPGLMLTLCISHEGNTQTRTVVITSGYTIGRGAQCSLMLQGDAFVGRRHASLSVRDGIVYLTDHQSQNGSFVREQRILANEPTPVSSGEVVRIGRHNIQVTY